MNENPKPEIKDAKVRAYLRMAEQARADGYPLTAELYEQAAAMRMYELLKKAQWEAENDDEI